MANNKEAACDVCDLATFSSVLFRIFLLWTPSDLSMPFYSSNAFTMYYLTYTIYDLYGYKDFHILTSVNHNMHYTPEIRVPVLGKPHANYAIT